MFHSSVKALFAAIGALMLVGSCDLNSQTQVEADARKIIFDPKSSPSAIAESVFAVFCAKNKCRERSDYDLNIPDVKVRTSVEFRSRRGFDMQQEKFDYFSCSIAPSAVYCDGYERPILLRDSPKQKNRHTQRTITAILVCAAPAPPKSISFMQKSVA
ncbi:MAG: hypothetical protein ACK5SF_15015 [Hyphomonadaceae bacterium]|jgi:hypothetical protein